MKARGGEARDGKDDDSGTLRTEKMPSGAQQYVRGDSRLDKSGKISEYQLNELDQLRDSRLNRNIPDFMEHLDKIKKFIDARTDEQSFYKKGGMIKEAGSGEMYASKAAMKKHEAKESPSMEKSEDKMRGGGIAMRGKGVALRGGGMAARGMGIALKGGGRAKGCM